MLISMLLVTGAFGFLGLSVLCPIAASLFHLFPGKSRLFRRTTPGKTATALSSVEIIIPAHNEAGLIRETLRSIHECLLRLQARPGFPPPPTVQVHVAADGCTDGTAGIAREFPGVSVTESARRGKWRTIKTLVEASSAEWIILADAGVLWPADFLVQATERLERNPDAIAFAPSYRPLGTGWLQTAVWRLETFLKKIETGCGGPISLHGATVGYETRLVKGALARLGDIQWLNDDVVIPLTMRALYPDGVILYPVGEVRDAGVRGKADPTRRRRMLRGNLQWVRTLLSDSFRRNPVAGTLAVRRVFRLFWAYWFVFVAAGLALAFRFAVLPAIAALGLLLAASAGFRQLAVAALVSLLAPLLILRREIDPAGAWR